MNDDKNHAQGQAGKQKEDSVTTPVPNDEPETETTSTTEIDIAPTTEIDTVEEKNLGDDQDAQEEVSTAHIHDDAPETWLAITDGKFKCSECDNEVEPETNTIEGVVKADLEQIKADLTEFPTKVIYGICPVCGMEFVFRLKNDQLFLEPSDLEK